MKKHKSGTVSYPILRNNLCAGVASGLVGGLIFNPLETVRVRWQMTKALHPKLAETSMWRFTMDICGKEGFVNGLWRPGIAAMTSISFCSTGLRLGIYPYLRNWISGGDSSHKTFGTMFGAGYLAGALGYWTATPLWNAKTRLQGLTVMSAAERADAPKGLGGHLASMAQEGGSRALFRGASPLVIRGAFVTAGQTLGYDGCKTMLSQRSEVMEDGPALHVVAAVTGAVMAALFGTPADVVTTRYQAAPMIGVTYSGPLDCARSVLREEGALALYRGFAPFFAKVAPVFLLFHPVFEQFRLLAGLGYMN